MIEITGLCKRFGEQLVLNGVDFDVREGETVALLGPSGCGKSVLLKHINGLIRPDAGEVLVDGLEVTKLTRKELTTLRTRIGYVFQNGALFDSMNTFENIRLGLSDESQYKDQAFCQARVAECLRLVNLTPDTALKYPAQLSGGMRKRVGIARAIALRPDYILFDEPTTGLDPITTATMDAMMLRARNELGATSVLVSHDMRSVFAVADRVAMLHEGRIRLVGTVAEIQASQDPVVRDFIEGRPAASRPGPGERGGP